MTEWKGQFAHPTLSAEAIFHSGENYQRAAFVLNEIGDNPLYVGYPIVHLTCISVELYLKCLAFLQKGIVVRGHDLRRLFMELPTGERSALSKLWESYFARSPYKDLTEEERDNVPWPPALVDALEAGNRAFEKSRYIWEHTGSVFMLSNLPELLRQYILLRHPGWNRDRLPSPDPITYAFGRWHGTSAMNER